MAELDALLGEIERQVESVQVAAAQEQMEHLLATIGNQELRVWETDLRRTIGQFLPKRRRALEGLLERRLQDVHGADTPASSVGAHAEIADLALILEGQLARLSSNHIFQWATFYRDSLGVLFDQLIDSCRALDRDPYSDLEPVEAAFHAHSTEIFRKGHLHFARTARALPEHVVAKGLAGLQRFLDLPLEFYSARVNSPRDGRESLALRRLLSAMLTGIATGFASLEFDRGTTGADALVDSPSRWAHVLPFVSASDLVLREALGERSFAVAAVAAVHPLASALDKLLFEASDLIALPALSLFNAAQGKFEVSLSAPLPGTIARNLDIHVYLDSSQVSRPGLLEASRRGLALVLAPLRPDLYSALQGDERLSQMVVDWSERPATTKRTKEVLDYALYRHRSARLASQPLRYNFAEDFPLHNPFLTRYVHVHRSSVRELARTFERRNGVRLWCSVRRSGKTTSCIDLGSSGSDSTFVIQTCAGTNQMPDGTRFYQQLLAAIESQHQLPSEFFARAVSDCAGDGAGTTRYVFVLDEYETLFGRLRAAVKADDTARYTIVQPLLDQMVAYTRDNLVVFLGQQPTAHYVFMEQNQLSAYVEQDSFPLFRRNVGNVTEDEFSELIARVFAERAAFDSSFADELFAETRGHPYLTVKLLTVFVDFLIERETPAGSLFLVGHDFQEFRAAKLNRRRLGQEPAYAFFREAVAEATSRDCKGYAPWLYCVYSLLRASNCSGG